MFGPIRELTSAKTFPTPSRDIHWPDSANNAPAWLGPLGGVARSQSSHVATSAAIVLAPHYVAVPMVVTGWAAVVATLSAGTSATVGLYQADPGTLYPGKLVWQGPQFSTATTGVKTGTVGSLTLEPGVYWDALFNSGAPSLRTILYGAGPVGTNGNPTDTSPRHNIKLAASYPATGELPSGLWGAAFTREAVFAGAWTDVLFDARPL